MFYQRFSCWQASSCSWCLRDTGHPETRTGASIWCCRTWSYCNTTSERSSSV